MSAPDHGHPPVAASDQATAIPPPTTGFRPVRVHGKGVIRTTPADLPWDADPPAPIAEPAWAAMVERLYTREFANARRYAAMLVGDLETGDDLAHEAFADMMRRLAKDPAYIREETAWHWLRQAMTHMAMRRKLRMRVELRGLARLGPRPTPDAAEISAQSVDLANALRDLPARQRACLVLSVVERLSYAEIGAELGIAPRTVEVHIREARKRLETSPHLLPSHVAAEGATE